VHDVGVGERKAWVVSQWGGIKIWITQLMFDIVLLCSKYVFLGIFK
jgi:hypothetical protein